MALNARHGRHFPAFVLLALAVLGPSHAPVVAEWLEKLPGGMNADLPSIYRTFQALREDGYVAEEWTVGGGAPRHVFRITPAGRQALYACREDLSRSRQNLTFFLEQLDQLEASSALSEGEGTVPHG
jgi:PadR family transcriptional regulator PadR